MFLQCKMVCGKTCDLVPAKVMWLYKVIVSTTKIFSPKLPLHIVFATCQALGHLTSASDLRLYYTLSLILPWHVASQDIPCDYSSKVLVFKHPLRKKLKPVTLVFPLVSSDRLAWQVATLPDKSQSQGVLPLCLVLLLVCHSDHENTNREMNYTWLVKSSLTFTILTWFQKYKW